MSEINTNKPISKVTVEGVEVELKGFNALQWKCDNMQSLQYEFYNYKGTDLSPALNGLDTSNVINMGSMFQDCANLTNLDLSNFNTSNINNMYYMFYGCTNLTELDLSSFNTSNVTTMGSMFSHCKKLTSLDLSNFNTSNVTRMSEMFSNCQALINLNLSGWDTSKGISLAYIFFECKALTEIIGTLDMINITSMNQMFYNCIALTTFTLKNIKRSLTIGGTAYGKDYGHLLDDPTIINTAQQLWDLTDATAQTLTVSTATSARLDEIYVKLITATEEMIANDEYIESKKPCEVCESTDEGAMTLREYIVSKNWTISG